MARALGRAFVRGGKPYSFRLLSPASSAHLCTEGDGFQSSRVKIFDRDLKRKQVESLVPYSLDLVISCLGLHWTNDLPGAMIQVRDAGNLLTRAGFTLPGVDVDEYTVKYDSGWFSLTEYRVIFHELVGYCRNL
ncbi:hypothetical protein GW17_00045786 [Ensete ventricosum]|nr:hypothetical protein GW17_00045786 [Ensete ventricosum]